MDKLSKNTVFYYLSKCIVLTDYNCNNIAPLNCHLFLFVKCLQ
uniref:Uncharacterized protein n=1 Tax=Anguilla anguilla TaxID=7936 RepID=A0A0E9UBV4_ANGAN